MTILSIPVIQSPQHLGTSTEQIHLKIFSKSLNNVQVGKSSFFYSPISISPSPLISAMSNAVRASSNEN